MARARVASRTPFCAMAHTRSPRWRDRQTGAAGEGLERAHWVDSALDAPLKFIIDRIAKGRLGRRVPLSKHHEMMRRSYIANKNVTSRR